MTLIVIIVMKEEEERYRGGTTTVGSSWGGRGACDASFSGWTVMLKPVGALARPTVTTTTTEPQTESESDDLPWLVGKVVNPPGGCFYYYLAWPLARRRLVACLRVDRV